MNCLPSSSRTKSATVAILAAGVISASAANILLVNFSSSTGNDMVEADATALGVDVYQNVRTNVFNTGGVTASIDLDSVTGGVSYNDYYQANQKAALGQPYATFVGSRLITSGTGAGSDLSVNIDLDLSSWLTAGDFSSYKVTVYYAGRSDGSQALTPDDVVTVTAQGADPYPAFWAGTGAELEFTGNNLNIQMDYLGGTTSGFQAGISAVKIEGVPEPTVAMLGAIGMLALIRRRR
jgi:hypothetical protein